jgi:hypothetical protein
MIDTITLKQSAAVDAPRGTPRQWEPPARRPPAVQCEVCGEHPATGDEHSGSAAPRSPPQSPSVCAALRACGMPQLGMVPTEARRRDGSPQKLGAQNRPMTPLSRQLATCFWSTSSRCARHPARKARRSDCRHQERQHTVLRCLLAINFAGAASL